jgi:hypothetical protein
MHVRVNRFSLSELSTSQGVDRSHVKQLKHTEQPKFRLVLKISWLTVRTPRANRPPFTLSAPPEPPNALYKVIF